VAGRVFPIIRMLLPPPANSLGVLGVPEIILVLRRGQPGPLRCTFAGLAAAGFRAIALALATPVIGKKKFLAVQALASASRRLHRFQSHKEPVSESRAKRRKKIQPEENSDRRRRKKSFQRIFRRTSKGRRSPFCPPVLHPFDFTGGKLLPFNRTNRLRHRLGQGGKAGLQDFRWVENVMLGEHQTNVILSGEITAEAATLYA